MSPLGEIASPSQPSATGTLPVTRPEEVSITLTEGGRYPPLSTSRYLPSGVSAVDMGSVSSDTWRPTGSRRQPLLSRKAPPGRGPTCSRGAGWEPSMATRETKAMARAMRYFSEPGMCVMDTFHCTGSGADAGLQGRTGGSAAAGTSGGHDVLGNRPGFRDRLPVLLHTRKVEADRVANQIGRF